MRRPFALWLIVPLAAALVAAANATTREQVAALFKPFLAEQVTLSPDGHRVAYTEHRGDELTVVIMRLEPPYAKTTLLVADDAKTTFSKEKAFARLRFLEWATPNRLVFAPSEERIEIRQPPGFFGPIYYAPILAVDADGKNPSTLIDGADYSTVITSVPIDDDDGIHHFTRSSAIVGFPAGDRDHLLVRALGYEHSFDPITTMVPTTAFKVNVHTGKKTELESDFFPGAVGYDQQGRSRLAYLQSPHVPEHSFALQGTTTLKFDEPWLGPLARKFTITPQNYFGERAFPLGFDADPNVLYLASNVGRDTFGVYAIDLKKRQRTDLAIELSDIDLTLLEPRYPSPHLVVDPFGGQLAGVRSAGPRPVAVWRDQEIAAAQRDLDQKFPQRTVEILEWSEARTAFLIRVTGATEPGRFFVYQKPQNLVLEILRRAPWLAAAELQATEFFQFDSPQGAHLTGYLTLPRKSRLNPPPAVVLFATGFPAQPHAEFDREAQVLAAMGLVVIRLNHRGVSGLGIKHRDAILAGIDRVPVEDALATVAWVAARHPIDRKRVAAMGTEFGGYLAVRALQLHPEAFRCAVACNAPFDLGGWLQSPPSANLGNAINFSKEVHRAFIERGPSDLTSLSVTKHPETITHPVFLLLELGLDSEIESANLRLRNQLSRRGEVVDYVEADPGYASGLPKARTRAYDRLEEFFNLNLYNYAVKIGPTKEIK